MKIVIIEKFENHKFEMRNLLLCFISFIILIISSYTSSPNLSSSCSGIDHCVTCHKGNIWYVCDQCDAGYGIDTKYDSSDECIYCDSVIPHCVDCSNKVDAWSCNQCAPGYKLVIVPLQDDARTGRSRNRNGK